jgi:hypothetical protein
MRSLYKWVDLPIFFTQGENRNKILLKKFLGESKAFFFISWFMRIFGENLMSEEKYSS